jgi:hypothetical protein
MEVSRKEVCFVENEHYRVAAHNLREVAVMRFRV